MGLRPKQRIFVKEYLRDKNATRAARAAGYSKKTAGKIGSENLSKPEVKAAIDEGLAKLAQKSDISAERVIAELSEIAFQKLNKNELKKISGHKLKALEVLAKHFKLLTDVHEVTGKDGGPQVIAYIPDNGRDRKVESGGE